MKQFHPIHPSSHLRSCLLALLVVLLLSSVTWAQSPESGSSISVDQAKKWLDQGKLDLILDVRTQAEFEGSWGHVPQAKLIPVQELPFRLEELSSFQNKRVAIICQTGGRSLVATQLLDWKGFESVYNIEGGTRAWVEKGFPVDHGASPDCQSC